MCQPVTATNAQYKLQQVEKSTINRNRLSSSQFVKLVCSFV